MLRYLSFVNQVRLALPNLSIRTQTRVFSCTILLSQQQRTSPLSESSSTPTSENDPLQEKRKKIPKANKMPPRPKIDESTISEKFIKGGSGKGGQKINKTNSKVQLTHLPTGIVVTSQATRSREQNRGIAREILALKIEEMEKGTDSRKQVVIARKQMLKKRAKKKTKAKYKKLAEMDDDDDDAAVENTGGEKSDRIRVIQENGEEVYVIEEDFLDDEDLGKVNDDTKPKV